MLWQHIGYAVLCVVAPAAWGLAVYWVSRRIEGRVLRQQRSDGDDQTLPLEYHI